MVHWFEDQSFWDELKPFIFGQKIMEDAPREIEAIIELLDLVPKTKILDVCCGNGRHSLSLARNGFQVTGVDRTVKYIHEARRRAAEESLDIAFIESDAREFSRENSFDAALLMYTVLGYFPEDSENLQVLKNVYNSLRKEGAILVELLGREILQRIFQQRDWTEIEHAFLLEERTINTDWSWMDNRQILIKEGDIQEFEFSHWVYSALDLTTMLEKIGFSHIEIYGSLTGEPYDENANRLVAVGWKK